MGNFWGEVITGCHTQDFSPLAIDQYLIAIGQVADHFLVSIFIA